MDKEVLERLEEELDLSWQSFRQDLLCCLQKTMDSGAQWKDRKPDFSLDTASTDLVHFKELALELDSRPLSTLSTWNGVESVDTTQFERPATVPEVSHSSSDSGAVEVRLGPAYLQSRIRDLSLEQQRAIRRRLRLRLGALASNKLVSGRSLHDAICALGLTRYSREELSEMLTNVAMFIGLSFSKPSKSSLMEDMIQDPDRYGITWTWPKIRESISGHIASEKVKPLNVVPAKALIELLLSEDGTAHSRIFGGSLATFQAIREVLLAGDTNRLVAELTFVRLNDLAVPPEPLHPLLLVESAVALLIVANAIMMGLQTDPRWENWHGWIYFEVSFTSLLLLEITCRMHFMRCHGFFRGAEAGWNCFDIFLMIAGVTDVVIQLVYGEKSGLFGSSLLRLCRLVRLVRIIKAFRLKFMGELRLMVKGLIAGLWTLSLAFTLLFTVLYVISGFATMTIGRAEDASSGEWRRYFQTLPDSMFTAWRCFTGECVTEQGKPLHHLLAEEYGVAFVLIYVCSYMLVSMGIFNVILAVYVDITMKAAKENETIANGQHARESIRIARVTRELLKKFAAAYKMFQDMEDADVTQLAMGSELFTDDDFHEHIAITKELFLLVIQDRKVQALMDDLDLPSERATLFEVIDSDGSGTLQVEELVHGLLKLRGEVSKADTVAALLAMKSLQAMFTEMKAEFTTSVEKLQQDVLQLASRTVRQTPSVTPSPGASIRMMRFRSTTPTTATASSPNVSKLSLPVKPEIAEDVDDVLP